MKHLFAFLGLVLLGTPLFAVSDIVNIGLFWGRLPSKVEVTVDLGHYDLICDGAKILLLEEGTGCTLTRKGTDIVVEAAGQPIGQFRKVKLVRREWGSAFKMAGYAPSIKTQSYHDNLIVSVYGTKLKLINNINIEHYIAGVVEAESGIRETYEYYKVQAIIARTYALSNINKFSEYGFNLCDRVNSQVYHGRSVRNPDIVRAVNATRGLVLVDSEINLINAVFHSNSGGQTVNSEDVWIQSVNYLRSIPDTFSIGQSKAKWTVSIDRDKWLSYLKKKYNYPVEDAMYRDYVVDYCPLYRDAYLSPLDTTIRMVDIRRDWNLRSTFFSIHEEGDKIVFNGRGFGHGVGLSQEGAMHMAEVGIPYNKILHFYYTDTHLIHLSALDFFRAD